MTIGPFIDMNGAVDVHVHSEPDLFPRIADDVGVARHAVSLGLRAFSLKCHSERTTTRAYMTMQQVPGIQVVGGIVLVHHLLVMCSVAWLGYRPKTYNPS